MLQSTRGQFDGLDILEQDKSLVYDRLNYMGNGQLDIVALNVSVDLV